MEELACNDFWNKTKNCIKDFLTDPILCAVDCLICILLIIDLFRLLNVKNILTCKRS